MKDALHGDALVSVAVERRTSELRIVARLTLPLERISFRGAARNTYEYGLKVP